MKTPLYCLPPLFKFCSNTTPFPPLPCHPQPSPPMFFLLPCFFAISIVLFAILLNDNMDLHMSSLGTLVVSEGPWCVFYATRRQVYRGLIHNMFFYWYSNLISHTQHTQGPVDWQTDIIHIYTTCYVLTATTFITLIIKWIIHWCQKFTFHNVFSFQKLFTCKSHISVD